MYTAKIKDLQTGETLDCPFTAEWDQWGDGDEFMWSEGNYGCDCNRRIFFDRVKGIGWIPGPNGPGCMYEGFSPNRFIVLAITLPSGEIVYREKEPGIVPENRR